MRSALVNRAIRSRLLSCPARWDAQPRLGHPYSTPERGPQRRTDLHDRAFPADRAATSDAQRRRVSFDDGDLRGDPPAAAGDSECHVRHAVSTRFAGNTLDERAVHQTDHDRVQHQEPAPEARNQRIRRAAGSGVVGVPGQHQGECPEQPAEGYGFASRPRHPQPGP